MATLFSGSSINWSSASWKVVDTTSYLYSEAVSTATTTSYVASANFMPGAITVEGILLRVKGTTTTPTGTFSVQLWNNTGSVQVAVVTCNATDIINNDTAYDGGWCYFKFAASQTLLSATNYQVRVLSSVTGTVTVYRNATAGNWSRGLVTSTTASLGASDDIIICGDITAAATTTVNTITFDNTAATSYGLIEVGAYGKILGQNSASTAYKLAINNTKNFIVSHNGIVEFSSTGTRLPSTSSFVFTITSSTAVNTGIIIRNYGTFRSYGTAKTRKAKLTADASAGATSLTTNVSTGWLNGDTIGLASTSHVGSGNEVKNLSAPASGTTLTIAALSGAHGGNATTGVQADIINLTSNFQMYGTSTVNTYYFIAYKNATVDCDNIEFRYLGAGVAGKRGIDLQIQAPIGSANLKDCVFRDFYASFSYGVAITNFNGGVTIDGCVGYGTPLAHVYVSQPIVPQGYYLTIQNCCFIGQGSTTLGMLHVDTLSASNTTTAVLINISNHTSAGGYVGYNSGGVLVGTISGITAYLMNGYGIQISNFINSTATSAVSLTYSNLVSWRNTTNIFLTSWQYTSGVHISPKNLILDTITCFGSINNGSHIGVEYGAEDILIKNGSFQAGVTLTASGFITFGAYGSVHSLIFDNCLIGTVQAHTVSDINMGNAFSAIASIDGLFRNCTFGTPTLISNQSRMSSTDTLKFQRFGGVAGTHRVVKRDGITSNDSAIYDSASVSQRLTPNSASYKLSSSSFQIAVASGTTATISIKVRKSVVGDGTAYNGNQPRLILKANPSAHASAYNSDIVAATATNAANGAWETLSYTLPSAVTDNVGMEFYVDCDGTTGWVNIDTITAT